MTKETVYAGRPAKDIYKVVRKNKEKIDEKSYRALKDKCVDAVTNMMRNGELMTEVDLEENDMRSLLTVTQEMRSLGYYYCLIETQDSEGYIQGHRLRISIAHLEESSFDV